jgi:transposase
LQIDPISSPVASSKTFQILDASAMRPRRKWLKAAKDRIIEEACAPDAYVSAIARAHGMFPTQLFRRRKLALSHNNRDIIHKEKAQSFTLVEVASESSPSSCAQAPFLCEVVIGALVLRVEPNLPKARVIELIRAVREA